MTMAPFGPRLDTLQRMCELGKCRRGNRKWSPAIDAPVVRINRKRRHSIRRQSPDRIPHDDIAREAAHDAMGSPCSTLMRHGLVLSCCGTKARA